MSRYFLEDGEKVRIVTVIIWYNEMCDYDSDNPYGALLAYCDSLHMPIAVSPLHDKDTYDEEDVRAWCRRHDVCLGESPEQPKVGQKKKAHVHVIIESKGARDWSFYGDLFAEYCERLNVRHRWQKVLHPDSAKRYLCHLDNEDKAKYEPMSIHGFGGIKLQALLRDEEFVKLNAYMYVLNYIDDNKVAYYHQILRWARSTGDYEIVSCVIGRTPSIIAYISSIKQEKQDKEARKKKIMEGGGAA